MRRFHLRLTLNQTDARLAHLHGDLVARVLRPDFQLVAFHLGAQIVGLGGAVANGGAEAHPGGGLRDGLLPRTGPASQRASGGDRRVALQARTGIQAEERGAGQQVVLAYSEWRRPGWRDCMCLAQFRPVGSACERPRSAAAGRIPGAPASGSVRTVSAASSAGSPILLINCLRVVCCCSRAVWATIRSRWLEATCDSAVTTSRRDMVPT